MKARREFIRNCCSLGAVGVGAHLTRLGLINAHAQTNPTPNYKALVCIFLFGGNDGNNTIIPLSNEGYSAYQTMRPNIALPANTLRPVSASGVAYGLHPRLQNIQALYNANKAAMLFNVGMLVQPTTRATLRNGTAPTPRNLYSHSDQTLQWQTSNPMGPGLGWCGRVADVLSRQNATNFPLGVSVQGNAAQLQGQETRPINLSPGAQFGLRRFGDGRAMDAREAGLQQVLTFDTGMQMVAAASGVMQRAITGAQEINRALQSGSALTTVFPQTNLGRQLEQVAKVIQVRQALGMNRQIFFCGMGGFDTHSDQLPNHDNLMGQIDAAVQAFYTATGALGVQDNVTTFTESEFGRTGNPSSSNGSDHAWGSHHFIIGGKVNGGRAYGTFPRHVLQGEDDAGNRGLWIPTTSLEQYAATMASWFGVGNGDLQNVFPNLRNFPTAAQNLGFLSL
jgi:uncharacterized protein (DUF1501 family)